MGGRPLRAEYVWPFLVPGGEVAGAQLVRELPAEAALLVWQAVRSLVMWSEADDDDRAGLFDPAGLDAFLAELGRARFDDDLRLPTVLIVAELALPEPSLENLAHACLCLAEWALAHGARASGAYFAEAAACAWPWNARFSWLAGRVLREQGKHARAELWLRRSLHLAVRADDWELKSRALMSLGNLKMQAGSYPEARACCEDALRVARRYKLAAQEGEALHYLFTIAFTMKEFRKADDLARQTADAYGSGHPRLPAFAYDLAYYWMQRGDFRGAYRLISALLKVDGLFSPAERLPVLGNAIRAAAACELPADYEAHAGALAALLPEVAHSPHVAPALALAASGAAHLKRWQQAEDWLLAAMASAERTGQQDTIVQAETLLEQVRRRVTASAPVLEWVPPRYQQLTDQVIGSLAKAVAA